MLLKLIAMILLSLSIYFCFNVLLGFIKDIKNKREKNFNKEDDDKKL